MFIRGPESIYIVVSLVCYPSDLGLILPYKSIAGKKSDKSGGKERQKINSQRWFTSQLTQKRKGNF
jgi:hypothetical protein